MYLWYFTPYLPPPPLSNVQVFGTSLKWSICKYGSSGGTEVFDYLFKYMYTLYYIHNIGI